MGKIILEFDSIEEQEEARSAIDGSKWKFAMWELDQYYRGIYKYSEVGSEIEEAERVRDKIREILSDSNLMLE
jgi:hypothetical protein